MSSTIIVRARHALTMTGEKEARGAELLRPLKMLDNPRIFVRQGFIDSICKGRTHAHVAGEHVIDLGDVCICPPLVNAHTHLQLSWLANATTLGHGFSIWLKSLVRQLLPVDQFTAYSELDKACASLAQAGIRYLGDIGGSIPGALRAVNNSVKKYGLVAHKFCEWFGFKDSTSVWPERCLTEVSKIKNCAPGAHALYSTSPRLIQKAYSFCRSRKKTFSIHLAESEEETELIAFGSGQLHDFYEDVVLPQKWQAPGVRPLAYAKKLGILAKGTLAVHGVELNSNEIEILANSGASLCLCPRSNINLCGKLPDIKKMLQSRLLLCLGSDGLTSSPSLDVREDASLLMNKFDLPSRVLVRMLTVNGARALSMPLSCVHLWPGAKAFFGILPGNFAE